VLLILCSAIKSYFWSHTFVVLRHIISMNWKATFIQI